MTKVVTGVYHEGKKVTEAVESLLERGVPVDEISVVIKSPDGVTARSVEVSEDTGTTRGAVLGGSIGASLGALGVTVVGAGLALTPGGIPLFAAGPALAVLLGGSALAGVATGAPAGLGRWDGMDDVPERALRAGAAFVTVHSNDLASLARSILTETGADPVIEGSTDSQTRLPA